MCIRDRRRVAARLAPESECVIRFARSLAGQSRDGFEGLLGPAERLRVLRGDPPGTGVHAEPIVPARPDTHGGRKGRVGRAVRILSLIHIYR